MRKKRFIQNAAIMTATTLLLRTIGIFFRIFISNRIGSEGMGLYQLIVSVYVLASSFAASGLTAAVTKLCADELALSDGRGARRVLRYAIVIGLGIGMLSVAAVCIGADRIAVCWIRDSRAIPSLYAMALSLPFMGISCCVKGYFLAKRKVTASSVSQILEQLIRIGVTGILLTSDRFTGVAMACMAVMIGDTVAEAVSCLYIVCVYWFSLQSETERTIGSSNNKLLRSIFSVAAPITAGRYINSGLRTIENTAIPLNVALFCHSREAALSDFGKLKGMALPLIFFPSGFLNAVSALLVPEVSEAKALGHTRQLQRTVSNTISLTLFSSYLIGAVFLAIGTPLSRLIYHDASVGYYICALAPLTPIMYLESMVVGLLKGLNQQTPSLIYSMIDSALRIALIYSILPKYGMLGMIGLMVVSNLLTCSMNLHRLLKVSGCRFRFRKWVLYPTVAVLAAFLVTRRVLTYPPAEHWSDLTICIVCTILIASVYIPIMFACRCIRTQDIEMLLHRKSVSSATTPIPS